MSTDIYRFAETISCHSWNADKSKIALCPNDNTIHIYSKKGNDWELEHTLDEHTQVVTGLDWGKKNNRLLSCSQDRNAYVWTLENNKWKPTLVILRLNRCATNVVWSPNEDKFAVGTGAKVVSICYFEESNDWWVSKHIKEHRSTVLSVKWHPNNVLVATASSDYKCRVISAWTKGVDKKGVTAPSSLPSENLEKFGTVLAEYNCNSWVKDVEFSPSGNLLAFVGQDSSFSVADLNSGKLDIIKLECLPLTKLIFPSETQIVSVGYNCEPYLFTNSGGWKKDKSLDVKQTGQQKGGNIATMWKQMDTKGGTQNVETTLDTKHQNTISWIVQIEAKKFTTSGLDGNIVWWGF